MFQSSHPAEGASQSDIVCLDIQNSYNPRTRIECVDSCRWGHYVMIASQSSHPAEGASITLAVMFYQSKRYNPRTRIGCVNPRTLYDQLGGNVSILAPE